MKPSEFRGVILKITGSLGKITPGIQYDDIQDENSLVFGHFYSKYYFPHYFKITFDYPNAVTGDKASCTFTPLNGYERAFETFTCSLKDSGKDTSNELTNAIINTYTACENPQHGSSEGQMWIAMEKLLDIIHNF
jgi:hypothetical protein